MRQTRLARLVGKIPQAIQRDGDGFRGRSMYLEGLVNEIVEAARAEGRRGLETLRGIVGASCAAMMIGRENDATLSRVEQTVCDNIDAACAWIERLP